MSLVKKLKDILFEEEEDYTEPIKITSERKNEEAKAIKIEPTKDEGEPIQIVAKPYDRLQDNISPRTESLKETSSVQSERELFKTDNTFQFPDFDEEEFDSSLVKNKQNTNVLEYERKKSSEKRNDYNRYEREIRDVRDSKDYTEKKKFKPSPIISPVYGVLNRDYKAEDIVNREDSASIIDIEEVRKKAFEMPVEEEKIEVPRKEEIAEIIDEPVVTFFEEKDKEVVSEDKKDDYKTIDDLLESASEEIPLEDTLELPKTNNLDAIEEELEKIEIEDKENKKDLDDTLDSDLFELIDSMYEEREEG